MDKKLSYLKISKPVLLIAWLLLSILSFTIVNKTFFNFSDDAATVIWIILFAVMIICSILNIIIGRKQLPKSYIIGALIFSIFLWLFSWFETTYIGYDPDSKRIIFDSIAAVSAVISVLLYTLPFRNKSEKKADIPKTT